MERGLSFMGDCQCSYTGLVNCQWIDELDEDLMKRCTTYTPEKLHRMCREWIRKIKGRINLNFSTTYTVDCGA